MVLLTVYPSPLELSEGSRALTRIYCRFVAQPMQSVGNAVFDKHILPSDGTVVGRVTLCLEHPHEVAHVILDGWLVTGSDGLKPRDHPSAAKWVERSIYQTEIVSLAWNGPGLYRRVPGSKVDSRIGRACKSGLLHS
ncbi:hypothetical protein PoB_003326200 [Plakobranchus ocellatus]|uniref:Uncharacterized protein n=1 Tax=Plakobranchus ocellatus TaxID=259542 RepID=A0AAV4AHM0_9GAST|nr:hypothetical protein PoB_003326200 [Plakobranchus ocellatus]